MMMKVRHGPDRDRCRTEGQMMLDSRMENRPKLPASLGMPDVVRSAVPVFASREGRPNGIR